MLQYNNFYYDHIHVIFSTNCEKKKLGLWFIRIFYHIEWLTYKYKFLLK